MRIPVTAVIAVFHQAGIPYPTGSLFDQFIIYEIVKQLPCLLVHRKLNNCTITENNFSRVQAQKSRDETALTVPSPKFSAKDRS